MAIYLAKNISLDTFMNTIFLVARYEIRVLMGKAPFWIFTLILPLFFTSINIVMQNHALQTNVVLSFMDEEVSRIGYVDVAGLIQTLPADVSAAELRAFADEASAERALQEEGLEQYFVIAPDYVQSGKITAVSNKTLPLTFMAEGQFLERILAYNLLDDPDTALLFDDPLLAEKMTIYPLETKTETAVSPSNEDNFSFLLLLFTFSFMFLFSGGQYILRSISRETENRTMELLLLSVNPHHFMWGKLLGLSTVALSQILIWGTLFSQFSRRFRQPELPLLPELETAVPTMSAFPPSFFLWAGIFLFLGFFMITALMLVISVVAPQTHFAVQISAFIMFVMLFIFVLNVTVISNPNGRLALILSLFPFTAPVSMLTRLFATTPPMWQIVVSLAGILLTIYLLVYLASRLIRADVLLTGVSFPSFFRHNQPSTKR